MKYFLFEVKVEDGRATFRSEGDGITLMEALGWIEWKKDDIFRQIRGEVKPDEVSRTRIIDPKEARE